MTLGRGGMHVSHNTGDTKEHQPLDPLIDRGIDNRGSRISIAASMEHQLFDLACPLTLCRARMFGSHLAVFALDES